MSKLIEAAPERFREPIAIVGMACRFPGAPELASFWRMLENGHDALSAPATPRFSQPVPDACDIPVAGVGGLLEHVDCFDAEFFGMSPHEASCLDPQQRLLLEVAWEAFEDAGLTREAVAGARAGVYVGIWAGDFENTLYASGADLDVHLITGTGRFPGPNRISYALDLRGPSMAVDTACSSSLVAVHLACQSIWSGESEFALAGGVNAILRPEITDAFIRANMLAPDRRCKFGDISANGFVRSEGAGMVVLKPLSKALRDRDPVYATIRGSAVNNDGHSNGMLLHPSGPSQESLLRDACRDAGIAPSQIQYVEAHGTGTSAGDPVEIEALGKVFGDADRSTACLVGSVKTNIGHSEGAAGIAGLIKVALSLWQGAIPASLHFRQPNPKISWGQRALVVPTGIRAWPETGLPAAAGVSAFGLTGTNAHVVLGAAPEDASRPRSAAAETGKTYLIPFSAQRPEALAALARAYATGDAAVANVADIAYTAAQRRTHQDERLALVAGNREEFRAKLDGFLRKEPGPGLSWGRKKEASRGKVAFVFPGQGAQWTGMGRQLFRDYPVFREEIERCHYAMDGLVDWSLLELFDGSGALPERIDVIQPALFAMSAGLARLWRHWGVDAAAVVGHSMGEVAAAYVAGALSLEDAAAVICRRSALMCRVKGQGSMALVEQPVSVLQDRLAPYGGRISIAASNSASSTVLSGETAAMQELLAALEGEQTFCRLIKVDVASHSAYVEPIREELLAALAGVRPGSGSIPMYSTVTGAVEYGGGLDGTYWVRNLREPVMFGRAIQQLIRDGFGCFIEMSPHPLLVAAVQAGLEEAGRQGLALPSLKREEDERASLLTTAGALYVSGHGLDWGRINGPGRCVSVPAYPFQREHVWPELPSGRATRKTGHAFLTPGVELSTARGTLLWDMEIGLASMPYLADHRVRGLVVFPGAGYLEIVLAAAKETDPGPVALEDVEFTNALVLPEGAARHVQLTFSPATEGVRPFQFSSRELDGSWTVLASGKVRSCEAQPPVAEPPQAIQARCSNAVAGEEHYRRLGERGLQYGPAFQLVDQSWHNLQESLVRIRMDKVSAAESSRHTLHPALVDAALQAFAELFPEGDPLAAEETYVPVGVERVRLFKTPDPDRELFAHAVLRKGSPGTIRSDVVLMDSAGDPVLEASGFVCRPLDRAESGARCLYELEWVAGVEDANAASSGTGRWILLMDTGGVSKQVASALETLGLECVRVHAGSTYRAGPSHYDVNPAVLADYQRLLAETGPCQGILHLWGLDIASAEDASPEVLDADQGLGTKSIVLLVRALSESGWSQPPRLWVGTAGLCAIGGGSLPISFAQGPVSGLARVIACEHPELRCVSVDLSPAPGDEEIGLLARTLRSDTSEDQIALRGATPYVARFRSLPAPDLQPFRIRTATSAYRAVVGEPGNLDSVGLERLHATQPGPGEVSIKIAAGGLNFIDVLKSLDVYPGIEPGTRAPLGGECAGTVLKTGTGVEHVRPGDAVVVLTPSFVKTGLLASHAVVPSRLVRPKPSNLTWEEAATVPLAFLTAWHGLHTLAGMRSGERVLIHAGTGGVGLAAIQLAQRAGATVFATAGSAEKRQFLGRLGVDHVFDSRSTAFAAEVLEATGGAGVDIVLNSLSGTFLDASLSTLGRYGRFIEIGKRDIYENRPLGLGPFRRSLSFFAVDLAAMLEERREDLSNLFEKLLAEFENGTLRPLPVRAFPASQAMEMFRCMAGAQHIGKLALTFDEPEITVRPARPGQVDFRADGGYLITGGMGGIGLLVARWMVENGARYLVLAGRREPSEQALAAIREMGQQGAVVRTLAADVSRPEEVRRLLAAFGDGFPALRGLVHAAAVVDDALVVKLDPARLKEVMAPKAFGAWNLHRQTAHLDLDFFVLFSSIASVLPQPGHAGYAAANAFLDALARHRRALGKPALSVNWGGWSGTGLALAAGASASIRGYAERGIKPLSGRQGLDALGHLLGREVSGALAVPVDWRKLAASYATEGVPAVLSDLVQQQAQSASPEAWADDPVGRIRSVPAAQRRELLEAHLRGELSRVLRLAPSRIERDSRLGSMGLDSLMAVTFVRRLSASLGLLLPATAAFNYPTIATLAAHVARKAGIEFETGEQSPATIAEPALVASNIAPNVEELSDEQAIEALLAQGTKQ